MSKTKQSSLAIAREAKLRDGMEILKALGFAARQRNEVAAYSFLALLGLKPRQPWAEAAEPLRGITPIIDFMAEAYGVRYAPNTRETIRDEAVKYFVEAGMLIRNPDDPNRPTDGARTFSRVREFGMERQTENVFVQTRPHPQGTSSQVEALDDSREASVW